MNTSAIIATSILSLLSLAAIVSWLLAKRRTQQQYAGLAALKQLKNLVVAIQKHRGLSCAFLNGDQQQIHALEQQQREVAKSQQLLADNSFVASQSRWDSFLQHWPRLQQSWKENNLENNIAQHSLMIKNLLFLSQDLAGFYCLTTLSKQHKNIDFLWHELLETAESIGQVRALGTGLAAAKKSSSVERIRLAFLHNKISQIDAKSLNHFANSFVPDDPAYQPLLEHLLTTIDEELIKKPNPSISVNEYFKQASKVLDGLYQLFDAGIAHLEAQQHAKHE
ncbi:nitrate- and nitrite sensing domain-containing protein [Agarivorans sp. 1_MG-2023]|uniref:nitrate- and nitrite sensing domain-containing protein n=1 Tax=Agarivorans sp. 1_MG-2023 TaxID=3062634 RepID=UPI0026E42D06|nr:nitrate- and nitrite sensing domain-containing protein [Agarivorans sp. 1_MG-2023]MDO6763598.1 nitrate- and nitrite sensing domain-containing protein [Agarivorans sp. 1_MG-2023]